MSKIKMYSYLQRYLLKILINPKIKNEAEKIQLSNDKKAYRVFLSLDKRPQKECLVTLKKRSRCLHFDKLKTSQKNFAFNKFPLKLVNLDCYSVQDQKQKNFILGRTIDKNNQIFLGKKNQRIFFFKGNYFSTFKYFLDFSFNFSDFNIPYSSFQQLKKHQKFSYSFQISEFRYQPKHLSLIFKILYYNFFQYLQLFSKRKIDLKQLILRFEQTSWLLNKNNKKLFLFRNILNIYFFFFRYSNLEIEYLCLSTSLDLFSNLNRLNLLLVFGKLVLIYKYLKKQEKSYIFRLKVYPFQSLWLNCSLMPLIFPTTYSYVNTEVWFKKPKELILPPILVLKKTNSFLTLKLKLLFRIVNSNFIENAQVYCALGITPFRHKISFFNDFQNSFDSHFQLVRPLFKITRLDTFYISESLKLPTYPDKSNYKVQLLRNRIRKQILPAIRILVNPQFDKIMCNFSDSFFSIKKNFF